MLTIMKFQQRFGCLLLAMALLHGASSSASPVYKWEDANGVVHYSSSPRGKSAKPADLPPIMRGELKLAQQKTVSCEPHGGVDCRAGADSDGSVVCSDGFKGASPRFRFSCSSPKLEVADIAASGTDGAFSVFVRNSKSVTAKKPSVSIKTREGLALQLLGPDTIEPYGLAEFQWKPDGKTQMASLPTAGDVAIACTNCP